MAKQKEAPCQKSAQELMIAMGAPSFEPIPPDQIKWQSEQPDVANEIAFWSWLLQRTIAFGRRSPYAVDEQGRDLYIEDAARELGWDPANARRAWRRLKARGVVRNGTRAEGSRRLYLCGKVLNNKDLASKLAAADESEVETEEAKRSDPTFSFSFYSPIVRKQLERLPADQQKAIAARLQMIRDRDDRLRADLDEARRRIIEQEEDTTFSEFGIRKIRIGERKFKDPAKKEAIAARDERIKALIPVVERYAQTTFEFGDPDEEKVCAETKNGSAQTSHPYYSEKSQRENVSPHKSVDVPRDINAASAPPPPQNGLNPEAHKAAKALVAELFPKHGEIEPPGSPKLAIRNIAAVLASASDIQAKCDELRTSHARFRPWWKAKRKRHPNCFVPQLSTWISDDDYLSPPPEEVLEGGAEFSQATNGSKRKELLEREKKIAAGEAS